MKDRLNELEKVSRLLEPAAEMRTEVRQRVIDYSENFLRQIETIPAFQKTAESFSWSSPVKEDPSAIGPLLSFLSKHVDEPGLNPASGGHLGYIPGGGIFYSALGDYLADVFNRYAGIYFASPGAVSMENSLIQWMAETLGYPKQAVGNLTSGGSIANLTGIICARDASSIKARDFEKSVIYLTKQVHHSVDKAIRIAGLKECILRYVPLDDGYRMNAALLEKMIVADKTNRLLPFLVIASAGTTDTGAVDPLDAIGDVAERHELWYHVDAAYGGFFMLTEEGKEKLKGIGLSDSLVVDPHKGLFLPYGSGAILVKDKEALYTSHHYQANYMQDAASEEISPADISPELTRHFRGLRLWLPLQLLGLKPFRACLEEKLLLAKHLAQELPKIGFEVMMEPELSVVTYRYVPKHGDVNEFNKRLVDEVQKDGRVFISSTMLEGNFILRAAILSFRTHLQTIETLLAVLKDSVKKLTGS